MNNEIQGDALEKNNQLIQKLPNVTAVAQTQVIMDENGLHPVLPEHKEMFDYKNQHQERNGY